MQLPLEIRVRRLELPASMEEEIRARAAKLERFYGRITGCRISIDGPGPHHRRGRVEVRLDLTVPGKELVITRKAGVGLAETVRSAFAAAGRRIEDHVRQARGYVKEHAPGEGRVHKLFHEYGFIKTPEGREIYFHRNAVPAGAFERLRIGTRVRFQAEQGEEGPQATVVRPPRKRRA